MLIDINECLELVVNGCYENSYCINVIGGYICFCLINFELKGDGKICECKFDIILW